MNQNKKYKVLDTNVIRLVSMQPFNAENLNRIIEYYNIDTTQFDCIEINSRVFNFIIESLNIEPQIENEYKYFIYNNIRFETLILIPISFKPDWNSMEEVEEELSKIFNQDKLDKLREAYRDCNEANNAGTISYIINNGEIFSTGYFDSDDTSLYISTKDTLRLLEIIEYNLNTIKSIEVIEDMLEEMYYVKINDITLKFKSL